jgi:hypothetical protein
MRRTVTYRGHRIRAGAIHVPNDRSFATRVEAEGYALHLGMRWAERHGA